jgi:hypothetical protein
LLLYASHLPLGVHNGRVLTARIIVAGMSVAMVGAAAESIASTSFPAARISVGGFWREFARHWQEGSGSSREDTGGRELCGPTHRRLKFGT